MNRFINEGRCRVCGKMSCCSWHQHEHERLEHSKYASFLEILPVMCRRCHRMVVTVPDLKTICEQSSKIRPLVASQSDAFNPERKRPMGTPTMVKHLYNDSPRQRKKLIPSRPKKKKPDQSPSVIVIDVNQIEMKAGEDIKNTVFSPQFNISFKILNSEVKSSTPLYDDKENLPVIAVFESNEVSSYTTPEAVQNSSLIIISAMKKKNSTPLDGIMNGNSKKSGRRVTFEKSESVGSPSEVEVSVYSTPTATSIIKEKKVDLEDADCSIEPNGCSIPSIVNGVKLALHGIPRSLLNAYDWSLSIIRRSSENYGKRKRDEANTLTLLKRRPISSFWVDKSVGLLARKPLPTYVERYAKEV